MTPTLIDLLDAVGRLTVREAQELSNGMVATERAKQEGLFASHVDVAVMVLCDLSREAEEHDENPVPASTTESSDDLLREAYVALIGMRTSPALTERVNAEAVIKRLNIHLAEKGIAHV